MKATRLTALLYFTLFTQTCFSATVTFRLPAEKYPAGSETCVYRGERLVGCGKVSTGDKTYSHLVLSQSIDGITLDEKFLIAPNSKASAAEREPYRVMDKSRLFRKIQPPPREPTSVKSANDDVAELVSVSPSRASSFISVAGTLGLSRVQVTPNSGNEVTLSSALAPGASLVGGYTVRPPWEVSLSLDGAFISYSAETQTLAGNQRVFWEARPMVSYYLLAPKALRVGGGIGYGPRLLARPSGASSLELDSVGLVAPFLELAYRAELSKRRDLEFSVRGNYVFAGSTDSERVEGWGYLTSLTLYWPVGRVTTMTSLSGTGNFHSTSLTRQTSWSLALSLGICSGMARE